MYYHIKIHNSPRLSIYDDKTYKNGILLNNHLISDSTQLVPDFKYSCVAWTAHNIRTRLGRCNYYLMHKWGIVDSSL
ncbi:Uncharacterized protein FWK35_00024984 [Aphis craccivora]|uniref:Uncharacterized protein n=1 Tax=Aphis craccivora TaxID=307492 RepID=A0A6G0ZD81_APHCR|nr:Uncharacterized protein FWK35_00024984 [Aphis craccivora]